MSIEIIKPGMQTSIQDLGRVGYMQNGVAHSGAFDPVALKMANWLVGNPDNHPALEITLTGPTIKFHAAMSIAIVGAEFELWLNGAPIFNNESIQVGAGDILIFDQPHNTPKVNRHLSARAYLAFSADLAIAPQLASYATNLTANFGGLEGRALKIGDSLALNNLRIAARKALDVQYQLHYGGSYLLRCTDSVESNWFDATEWQQFFNQSYQITSDSNRMGLRLKGQALSLTPKPQVISSGLTVGSIQIPQSGQPIISGVDGQTIGGYPRIANVISADLNILGQLKANDRVNFRYVEPADAISLLKQKNLMMENIKHSIAKL